MYLGDAVRRGLAGTGLRKADVDAVAVDLGPGGLTATRGGVTFANALAWGLGVPLVPLDYFDLVTAETGACSAVVCIRPTTAGQGFFREGDGPLMVDDLATLARQCRARLPDIVLAGVVTPDVTALFPGSRIGAAGARRRHPGALCGRGLRLRTPGTRTPRAADGGLPCARRRRSWLTSLLPAGATPSGGRNRVLGAGGVVLLPTDTVYGLAVSPDHDDAIDPPVRAQAASPAEKPSGHGRFAGPPRSAGRQGRAREPAACLNRT